MSKPEALIFDLDGTLWDAVPTYAQAWNAIFQDRKLDLVLHPNDLYPLMGMQTEQYLSGVLPGIDASERLTIYEEVVQKQYEIIPTLGGKLYSGVAEGLARLSSSYKILILSNCPTFIIHHFLQWSGMETLITDHLSFGQSPQSKAENIKLLMERNNLATAMYVGDTHSDAIQAQKAAIPFIFAAYGFGNTDLFQLRFDRFEQLTDYFSML